jgi:transketolase
MIDLKRRRDFVFFTGDLGYGALEPLREAMGRDFINAGVAEQNMVSVGAGVAADGRQAWLYSIAPFIYARPFEQVRNDVCIHGLDVKLVGNGGGYGYGSMGATHHALEDYGVLLTLKGMRAHVPAFDEDVAAVIDRVASTPGPAYLRLGRGEPPKGWAVPAYAPWRLLCDGAGPVVVAVGPLAGTLVAPCLALPLESRPQLWALGELPVPEAPPAFLAAVAKSGHLAVVEEHVATGGAGQALGHGLLLKGLAPRRFSHFFARGYSAAGYGSQQFHRKDSGLDAGSILKGLA